MANRKNEQWLKNLALAQERAEGAIITPDNELGDEAPSRSQLKRESAAVQELGEELCKLPGQVLIDLGVDEELREAIIVWQKTATHEGKRRQMQYVGRLMRNVDTRRLFTAWQKFKADGAASAKALHEIEELRQRLIDNAPGVWSEVFSKFPDIDKHELEQLVKEAREEQKTGKPPRAFRAVFRFLREAGGIRA